MPFLLGKAFFLGQSTNSTRKAGEKVLSSFVMAQTFLRAKIRQISYISKYFLAINVSSTKYSYISNQRELPSMSIISSFSILPPILFRNYLPSAGVSLCSPPACGLPLLRSLGYSLPSKQGLRFAHPCLWSCQPFGLAFHFHQAIKGITELTELRPILARARLPERNIKRIMNFARKRKPKRKTPLHSLKRERDCKTTGDIVSTGCTRAQ